MPDESAAAHGRAKKFSTEGAGAGEGATNDGVVKDGVGKVTGGLPHGRTQDGPAKKSEGLRPGDERRADFDRLVVLPLGTSDEANLGAIARAMANFGFRRLTIAAPRAEDPKSGRARALAAGAEDTLLRARVVPSLDAALEMDGVQLLAGTTARRSRARGPFLTPLEWAVEAWREMRAGATVGLLLGREDTGLLNEEIDRCHWKISIPTSGSLAALNLAQASLLLLHTLQEVYFRRLGAGEGAAGVSAGQTVDDDNEHSPLPAATGVEGPASSLAPAHTMGVGDRVFAREERGFRVHSHPAKTAAARRRANVIELERLAGDFHQLLIAIGYSWADNPGKVMRPFRHLMARARPTSREIGILTTFIRRTMMTIDRSDAASDAAPGAPDDDCAGQD
jgi:TrmH family RNA methyltransferase